MTMQINGTSGLVFNDASTQNTAATGFGFKNRIINGAMMIDQRNAGASVTPAGAATTYTLDRWNFYLSQASKLTTQRSTVAPAGFVNSLLVTSSSAYSVLSSDEFDLIQYIEGFNTADLGWGTANAAPVTLSFWVRSSLTGTFGGAIQNGGTGGYRSYPFSYTINAANTFEYKTVTIAGDTSGTWGTANGIGLNVVFGLGQGSNFSGTAGAWVTGNRNNVTGATSVVGTNGATFYITGVQLEKGSTATSFDYRPYGTEMQLCQRYFQQHGYYGLVGQGQNNDRNSGGYVSFPVPMRATPSTLTRNYEVDIGDLIVGFTPLLYLDSLGQAIGWRPYRNTATTITRGDTLTIDPFGTLHPFSAEL